jgi:hypothetical protein
LSHLNVLFFIAATILNINFFYNVNIRNRTAWYKNGWLYKNDWSYFEKILIFVSRIGGIIILISSVIKLLEPVFNFQIEDSHFYQNRELMTVLISLAFIFLIEQSYSLIHHAKDILSFIIKKYILHNRS